MTASSSWDKNHGPYLARLHRPRRGRLMGAWCSRHKNHNQWLQIDMGRAMKVSGINTQGRQDADQWVTAYYVLYGSDGTRFSYVREWWDNIKVSWSHFVLLLIFLLIVHVLKKEDSLQGSICQFKKLKYWKVQRFRWIWVHDQRDGLLYQLNYEATHGGQG